MGRSVITGFPIVLQDVAVDMESAQSIAGVKTFESSPIVPTAGIQIGDTLLPEASISGGNLLHAKTVTYTETDGAGAYTGSVVVPAGAWLIDIIVHGVALWDNAGAVDMDVGVTGTATAFFDITSLKAGGDLVAGESISFSETGSENGTLQATNYARYSADARTILGVITTASTGGSTGRTRMTAIWMLPTAGHTSAAVKV